MSLPRITPTDLDTLVFKRFKAVFGLAGAWSMKDDPHGFAVEWLKMFKYFHPEELTRGVDIWLTRNKGEWPKPGQLMECIVDSRPKRETPAFVESSDLDDCGCKPGCRWSWYRLEGGGQRRMQDCVAAKRNLERAV